MFIKKVKLKEIELGDLYNFSLFLLSKLSRGYWIIIKVFYSIVNIFKNYKMVLFYEE